MSDQRERAVPQTRFERWVFAFFLFALPFQARLFLADLWGGGGAGEWTRAWLWASDVFLLLLFVLWAKRGISRNDLKPLLFVLVLLPSFFAHPTALGLWSFLKVAEGMLLFSYVRRHRTWLLTTALWPYAFLFGIAVNALAGFSQFVFQHDLGLQIFDESPLDPEAAGVAKVLVSGTPILRAYGLTPHPNILAAFMLAGIAVVTFLYIFRGVGRRYVVSAQRQREELVRGGLLFLFLTGLVLAFSRIGWAAAGFFFFSVIAVVLLRASLRKPYLWETLRFFMLFVVATGLVVAVFWPFVDARRVLSQQDETVALRMFYGHQALQMIIDEPWLGVGFRQFVPELVERNPLMPPWQAQPVHNVPLLIAAENGLPAAFVLIAAFTLLMLATWRRVAMRMHDPGVQLASVCLLAFATGLLLFGSSDHFLWTSQQGWLLLWMMLGLLAP